MLANVVHRYLLSLVCAVTLAALAACASMPVASMMRLSRTDFSTVDPSALRAALKLPGSVRPRATRLQLTVSAGGEKQVEEFNLTGVNDLGELTALRRESSPGTSIFVYRLAAADIARLNEVRADVLGRRAGGARVTMAIGVAADGCRTGPLPETIPLTTYLRTEAGGEFFALMRDVDLRKALAGHDLAAKLPTCN